MKKVGVLCALVSLLLAGASAGIAEAADPPPVFPGVSSVDQDGQLLQNITVAYEYCSEQDNDPGLMCWDEKQVALDGISGLVPGHLGEEPPLGRSETCEGTNATIVFRQLTAPKDYRPASGSLKLCNTRTGWIVDNQVPASSGISYDSTSNIVKFVSTKDPSGSLPVIRSIDQDGQALIGISFGGEVCVAREGGSRVCSKFEDYPWSKMSSVSETDGAAKGISLTTSGSTGCEGTTATFYQLTVPNDYLPPRPGALKLCQTATGWVVDDTVEPPGSIEYDPDAHEVRILSEKRRPMHLPLVTAVDQAGNPLDGMTFRASYCTKWDGETEWACTAQDLSVDMSNPLTRWVLQDTFPVRENDLGGDDCEASTHRLTLFDVAAPQGYTPPAGALTLCLTTRGWVVGPNPDGQPRMGISLDGGSLVFANTKPSSPTTASPTTALPTPSLTPVVPSVDGAARGLPRTGDAGTSALVVGGLVLTTMVAAGFARARRRT